MFRRHASIFIAAWRREMGAVRCAESLRASVAQKMSAAFGLNIGTVLAAIVSKLLSSWF